ncbi:MAG: response regulator transcription factor [Sediminibacterium sp.]|jgi:DNA-binding response OmpR family regulator|nr:response regulator [Chitinophagaceae bacterium]MCA6447638.1 response regulator [Chitinophagaceae bacterium]
MIQMITRSLQILIVDDAHFILDRLAALINEYAPDSSIRSAVNAEQGLALVAAKLPDIVILDINLPDFSGIEVLKKIREKHKVKPVIIMLTNNTISDYRLACLELGANYFLDKSKDFLMLTTVIDEVINLKYLD